MNRIVSILMKRDNMTETEAKDLLATVQTEVQEAVADGDYDLVEEIIACDLGLEMDYAMDILF
jgi:hypothetical protein